MQAGSVSIIIPVYNVGAYVEDCLRSVMRQTFTGPMECILVDDCGTDDSIAKVESLLSGYAGPIVFKILHHAQNRGLSAARNTGMDAATGEYLFFLDSDDELTDGCIASLMAAASEDPSIEIVQGNAKSLPEQTSDFFHKSYTVSRATTNREVRSCYYHSGEYLVNAWNKLIKRSFLLQNKLYFKEGILYEDWHWSFYLLKYVTDIRFVQEITYLYKQRDDSITAVASGTEVAFYDKLIYQEILENLTPHYENEEFRYFVRRFSHQYVKSHAPEYDELFRTFWRKAGQFGLSGYRRLITMFLAKRSRVFRSFVVWVSKRKMAAVKRTD